MRKLHWSKVKIDAKKGKELYFQQMKVFCEARARKRCEKELHIHINNMHTHMSGIELKEEEIQQCEEAIKKWEGELRIREEQRETRGKKRVMSFHCTQ
jgi:hypothetical protein